MMLNPALPPSQGVGLHITGGGYAGNDMVPIGEIDTDSWPGDYHTRSGTNLGVGAVRFEAIGSERGWHLGYFYRQDWFLKSNRDTVDAHYLQRQDQLTDTAREYNLDYTLRGFSADGLRLGYSRSLVLKDSQRLTWGISLSYLQGHDVRLEEGRGRLVSQVGSGTLNGSRHYYDTRLSAVTSGNGFNDFVIINPAGISSSSNGKGHGLDLGFTWSGQRGEMISLVVNDLAARIRWDRVPYIEQRINNLTDPFVPGGSPAVSGVNRYSPLTLRLKPKYQLKGAYPFGRKVLTARLEGTDGQWFPQVGLAFALSPQWKLGVNYEARFGGLGIALSHRLFYLGLNTRALDIGDSRVLGLTAGLRASF